MVTIDSGPASGFVTVNNPSWTFSSTDGTATFQCRVDSTNPASFTPCTSPRSLTGLSEGAHTFDVFATDPAGNVGATVSRAITVDTIVPDTTITGGITGLSNSTTQAFTFTSPDGTATFQCRIDSTNPAAFSACTTPKTFSNLGDGPHTVDVRAVDPAGNADATPATRSFTIDATAPDTSITGGPSGSSNDPNPSFTFTSPDGTATFQCRMDAGVGTPFVACSSPKAFTGVGDGGHTFEVRAVDAAGNPDSTPAQQSFSVDTENPVTIIDSGPSGLISATSAGYQFHSTKAGSTFECTLDGGPAESCTSGKTYSGLADGPHTFSVQGTDSVGNTDDTPAHRDFTVDATPPNTNLTSGPSGSVNSADASFEFNSEAGATFECRLDSASPGAFAPCTSAKSYSSLGEGAHTFSVRAVDAAGNPDPTPSTRTWTVDLTPPDTTIDSGPDGTTTDNNPSFTFSSADVGATFECRRDAVLGGAFVACSSPKSYLLANGDHTIEVRAVDAAGNADPTPAVRNITVTPLDTEPDNTFSFGKVVHNKDGSSTLPAIVPGAGKLVLTGKHVKTVQDNRDGCRDCSAEGGLQGEGRQDRQGEAGQAGQERPHEAGHGDGHLHADRWWAQLSDQVPDGEGAEAEAQEALSRAQRICRLGQGPAGRRRALTLDCPAYIRSVV